jgi:hypothetical protein
MRKWVLGLAAMPIALGVAVPAGAMIAAGGLSTLLGSSSSCSAGTPTGGLPAAGSNTAEQRSIAAAAVREANTRHLPDRAKVVILATGFQESGVRNLHYGDRDSVGWLQQRAGWGPVAERMNPQIAAGKFYDHLVRVAGWQSMSVTQAAQAVQISAYPNAYAKWETRARQLLASVSGAAGVDDTLTQAQCPVDAQVPAGQVPGSFNQQGNPRTVEQAIAMMTSHPHGWGGYGVVGHCEGYMTRAYGWPGGYPSARAHWYAPGARTPGMSPPPRGALVFWSTGAYGHVAMSLGGGMVVSTDFDGRRYHAGVIGVGPIGAIDKWGTRLGWRPPTFRVG